MDIFKEDISVVLMTFHYPLRQGQFKLIHVQTSCSLEPSCGFLPCSTGQLKVMLSGSAMEIQEDGS